jgi:hypothetical protein
MLRPIMFVDVDVNVDTHERRGYVSFGVRTSGNKWPFEMHRGNSMAIKVATPTATRCRRRCQILDGVSRLRHSLMVAFSKGGNGNVNVNVNCNN